MRKLTRKKAHREHLIRNLATSLVLYESIETTAAKAKEVKCFLDGVIASAKTGDLTAIRKLHGIFFDRNAVDKVMKELLPRYKERNSGFIKSYHLRNRNGDNSEMIKLELVDKKTFVDADVKVKVDKKSTSETAKETDKNADDSKDVKTKVKVKDNAKE